MIDHQGESPLRPRCGGFVAEGERFEALQSTFGRVWLDCRLKIKAV